MARIYIPATNPDDWRQFLKDPDKHWKTGYSARTLAHCWHDADGWPAEINAIFIQSDVAAFQQAEPLLVIPELITPIAGSGEYPHSDVFVLAKTSDGQLVSITIEGKVNEPFGTRNEPVHNWKRSGDEANRRTRLEFLLRKIALSETQADNAPYQLIQRTASAVVEAERYNARYAVMLVHSFSPTHSNYDAYRTFLSAFGIDAEPGQLVELSRFDGIRIFTGWSQGHERYLST